MWLTCCALHNMLLEVDGLDQHWDGINASTSAWENELGNLDEADVPLAISRILTPSEIRDYDSSSVGNSQIPDNGMRDDQSVDDDDSMRIDKEVCNVRNLSLNYFRSKLVEHFDIMFWNHEVHWPKWRGATPFVDLDN